MGTGDLPRSIGGTAAHASRAENHADQEAATVNVARFLPAMAAKQPDVLALRVPVGDRGNEIDYLDLTFRELDEETDAWAHRLDGAGIRRGMRVLLLVKPGLPLIGLSFALFKIGAVPVVIDPGMGLWGFLDCVSRTRPEALVAIPMGIRVGRLFRGTFSSVRIRVSVDPKARLAGVGREAPVPYRVAPTRSDELAAILFTSGSTGAAKGVCYEHAMFEAQVDAIRAAYDIQPGEVDLPMLPIFALFNPALGMTTVVPEINPSRPATVNPERIVKAIKQCGVTNSFGSPVLWQKIGGFCHERNIKLDGMRRVLMAGAPVPPSLMEAFRGILSDGHVHSPYGATEALPVSSVSDFEILEFAAPLTLAGRGTCVGKPVPQVDVRIIRISDAPIWDWKDDLVLPPDEIGEIIVRGPAVTRAYDKLPAANESAKIRDGSTGVWHRMGDTGYLDGEGRLWFCGRKAERVVGRDGVFYTDQCEPIFNQHPRVARTALIGLGTPGQQEPAIVVEPNLGDQPRLALARAALAQELRELGRACEKTKDIKFFFFRKKFPVDVRHNAKIHRLRLARIYAHKKPVRAP